MRKIFVTPALEIRCFMRESILTASAGGSNMTAAKAQSVSINNQTIKINEMTMSAAALK